MLHIFLSNRPAQVRPGTSGGRCRATTSSCVDDDGRRGRRPTPRATSTCAGDSMAAGYWCDAAATPPRFRRRAAAHRRHVHPLRRRLLDVPRSQRRHDRVGGDLGVAGRGRGRAGRPPRRARGRGRRPLATSRARAAGRLRRGGRRARRSTRPSSRSLCKAELAGVQAPEALRSSWPSCRRRRPARSGGSSSAPNPPAI